MTAETSNARGEWVLVPRELTPEMREAWEKAPARLAAEWAALLAAAPPPAAAQQQGQGGGEVAWRLAEEIRVPVGQRPRSANDSPLSPPIVTEWETHYRWVATVSTITKTPAPPSAPVGVEALCQVYYDAYHAGHHDTVEGVYVDVFPVDRDTYWQEKVEEDYADALAQQPSVPVGWKLVPVEPAEAMREAFHDWRPSEGDNYAGAQSVSSQDRWEFRQRYAAMLAAAPALAQQPAAVDEKYAELIYAVSRKYPGESRHETALRYIRQAESVDHGPAQAATQHQEPKS